MSIIKQIVFLKDKSGAFKLRDDIKSFGYDERTGQYYVQFKKGDNYLHYNPANVDVACYTRQLEPPFRITRKSDGEVFFHVLGVRVFEGRENNAYRIIYENGSGKNYPADYVSIEEHLDDHRSINVWEYLNEVAKYNVIPLDDDKTISLADKYAKMEFVAKNSLLEAYLNVDTYGKPSVNKSSPIFPFGCNRSQYKAVQNALENRISVIQGPPGTGKTQTILNILANLLLDEKTMEIVSNNNSAVENVKEKLVSTGLDFLCAQLGRASNKKEFVDRQTGSFPDMESWKLDNAKKVRLEAVSLSRELQELYECQEKLALCSERLSEYKRQVERFPKKTVIKRLWPVGTLEKYFLLCNREMELKHHLSWWTRFRLRYHRLPATEDAQDELQYILITTRIKELEQQCTRYREYVKDADTKNSRLRDLSMLVLKDHLYRKYGTKKERTVFSPDELYLKTRSFLQEYPVVLSTTFSATSNINPAYKFDYLIMDEASQVDIAAGALALSCARNAVIVGDLKQLPNVVDCHTEEVVSAIFAKYGIAESYRYSTNSFLSSLCTLYPKIPQTLLKEHYRCDPLIIGFCSKQFYNGELIPMKKSESEFAPIRVVRTVKGNHARGTVNFRQVDTITQEILPALEEQFTDIGIIAPYNNQVNALHAALQATGRNYVAATIHKFQGREDDVIILSTVDNQIQEFTDDPHLLNVAVSRAKKQFTLVVSADEQPDSNIQDLIDYIEYYQGKSEQSEISSIFDLLYEDYTQELLEFYEKHKRVSEYDSENLAYWAIHDTIKEKGLNHLGVLMHYPLRHLVTSASNLTPEQRAYASRSWTHVDFLVYDSVSHKAKLAIEVDGTQYHKTSSDQGRRDVMKDSILASIGLPILRLSTAGSQEKEKIRQALSKQ
jgi:Superfamily I DNA and RNA helicases and helicase subunits